MSDQLCTAAQVKARLTITDGTDDTVIGELIDQVTAWVQLYTGRRFIAEPAATYTVDTRAGYRLLVPRGIRVVTSLQIAGTHQPDTGGTYVAVAAASILLRPSPAELMVGWPPTQIGLSRASGLRFSDAENGAKITGDFGWSPNPLDLVSVVIDAVVSAYTNRQDGASGVIGAEAAAVVPWSEYFGPGSPQRQTLDRYRFMSV